MDEAWKEQGARTPAAWETVLHVVVKTHGNETILVKTPGGEWKEDAPGGWGHIGEGDAPTCSSGGPGLCVSLLLPGQAPACCWSQDRATLPLKSKDVKGA